MQLNTTELLNSKHYSIMAITVLCSTVAFFDFISFVYLADLFSLIFFGNQDDVWIGYLQTFFLLITGYLARPVGGLLFGKYGDTHGRKPAFMLSILGVMITTLLVALLPTYQQIGIIAPLLLMVARFGQGVAIGGALPAAWTFIVEHLPIKNIGLGCGLVCASSMLSYLVVIGLVGFLQDTLTSTQMLSYGWRIPFLIGGTLGLVAAFLLKNLPETTVFDNITKPIASLKSYIDSIHLQEQPNSATLRPSEQFSLHHAGLLVILKSIVVRHKLSVIISVLISFIIGSSAIYLPALIMPLLASHYQISNEYLYFGSVIGLIFLMLGSIMFGYLTDRFGAGRVLAFGGLLLITQVMIFFHHLQDGGSLILLCFALLGLSNGLIGALPSIMTRIFPAKVRMTGLGICYNTTIAVIGGILPFVLGYASFYFSFAPALYLAVVGMLAIFLSFFMYYTPRSERDLNR